MAGKRIGFKNSPTDSSESVDAFSEVNRLHRQKNAHLGGYLDHEPWLQKDLLNCKKSRRVSAVKYISILAPFDFSILITL